MYMNVRSQAVSAWLLTAGFTGLFLLVWWIGRSSPVVMDDYPDGMAVSINMTSASTGAAAPAALILQPVTGHWAGNINLGRHQSELLFTIEERNGQLSGTVRFPVGAGVIQTGSRVHNQVSMTTLNTSSGTGQTLRTEFSGQYEGDVMHLVMKTETGADELTLQRTR